MIVCKSCVISLKVVNTDKENSKRKLSLLTYSDLEKQNEINTKSTDNTSCENTIYMIGKLTAVDNRIFENEMRQKPGHPPL